MEVSTTRQCALLQDHLIYAIIYAECGYSLIPVATALKEEYKGCNGSRDIAAFTSEYKFRICRPLSRA